MFALSYLGILSCFFLKFSICEVNPTQYHKSCTRLLSVWVCNWTDSGRGVCLNVDRQTRCQDYPNRVNSSCRPFSTAPPPSGGHTRCSPHLPRSHQAVSSICRLLLRLSVIHLSLCRAGIREEVIM